MTTITYKASNNGNSTLAGALTALSTSGSVYTGQGTRFPTINDGGATTDEYTKLTLQKADGTKEIVHVVRHDAGTDAFTIGVPGTNTADVAGRGQEGTSATTWSIGDIVSCRPTASLMQAAVNLGATIAGATAKAAPVDADSLGISDSEDVDGVKKTTWANIKAALKTYLDTLYLSLTGGTMTGDLTMGAGKKIIFKGTTDDAFELTIDPGDPTADRTQTHQDAPGTIALIGVKEVIGCFPVGAMKVPVTSGAAPLAWDESTTHKVMTGYMAFDKDAIEYAQFSFRAPQALDKSAGFKALFIYKEAGSATSHDCVWQIEMQAQGDGDTIDSAWGTAVTVTDTSASGKRQISPETAAITPGGSWAAGDEIIVRVSRKATDGADTLDVDAHLIEVVLMATYAVSTEP